MTDELLMHHFKTEQGNDYIFDGCTGMVYPVNEVDLKVICLYKRFPLDKIIHALMGKFKRGDLIISYQKVRDWIEIDHAFYPIWQKGAKYEFMSEEDYTRRLANVSHLVLELTEACNLRCKYCIYGQTNTLFRDHGFHHMTWEIAKKSIDYFVGLINSPKRTMPLGRARFSFYGGESLLKFPLMRKCVEYIKSLSINNSIDFGITTNGILLNEEVIRFFIENQFDVTISLDGPESEHDKNRLTRKGNKTFPNIWNSLKRIRAMDKEYYKKHITFNAVYTPITDLDKVAEFFNKKSPYTYNQGITFKPVDPRGFDYKKVYGSKIVKEFETRLGLLQEQYYDYLSKNSFFNAETRFLKLMFDRQHREFKQRFNLYGYNSPKLASNSKKVKFENL